MKWYEKDETQFTPPDFIDRRHAYLQCFYGGDEGRAVLCDLRRRVAEKTVGTPEEAVAKLLLLDFIDSIPRIAGAVDAMALVKAEGVIAFAYEEPQQEDKETDLLDADF